MVANLPYYAAAPIVRRFLETVRPPTLMVVMVQREVADAMNAKPGERSRCCRWRRSSTPQPSVVAQVAGAVFSAAAQGVLHRFEAGGAYGTRSGGGGCGRTFFALVRAGFNAPRKQLRNSLMQGTGATAEMVTAALARAGIDSQRRPATLEIAEWAVLDAIWPAGVSRSRPV